MLLMSPSYTATAYLGVHTRNSGAADVPGSAASAAATEEAAIDTHLTVLLSDAYLRRLLPTLRELDAADNNKAAALPKWRERASTFFRTASSKTKELLFLNRHQSSDGEALVALKKSLKVGQERRSRIVSITLAGVDVLLSRTGMILLGWIGDTARQASSRSG
jgi:polysaccharide biosynthesis transport protein